MPEAQNTPSTPAAARRFLHGSTGNTILICFTHFNFAYAGQKDSSCCGGLGSFFPGKSQHVLFLRKVAAAMFHLVDKNCKLTFLL